MINGEDCCETSANGFPCSCHLFRNDEDDGYGDYLRDMEKDAKIEKMLEEEGKFL